MWHAKSVPFSLFFLKIYHQHNKKRKKLRFFFYLKTLSKYVYFKLYCQTHKQIKKLSKKKKEEMIEWTS